jgi:Flp pilus assembly protein TadB
MSQGQQAIVLGMLGGLGVILTVTGLRPAPPRLDAVLARLYEEDHPATRREAEPATAWRLLVNRLAGKLSIPHRDLALIGMSAQRFIGEKAGTAVVGLLVPTLMSGILALAGLALPWQLPAVASLAGAGLLFYLPDLTVRSAAERRRTDFRHAVSAYLDFVRLALGGGAGPSQALQQAPHMSGGWAFTRIADAIDAAAHARIPPWEALARLGEQIGVDELRDLADLADLAGTQGAKIADTLSAYTHQMRNRRLADLKADAASRTTTMTAPIAGLGLAFIVLLGFPQIYLLLAS